MPHSAPDVIFDPGAVMKKCAGAAGVAAALFISAQCSSSGGQPGGDAGAGDAGTGDAGSDAASDLDAPVASELDAPKYPFDGPVIDLDAAPPLDPCNGALSYCVVTYDQLTYPATHAAMAYATPPFLCPAQDVSPRTQLDDGVRALEIEAHALGAEDAGTAEGGAPGASEAGAGASLVLCDGDCALGATPIGGTLADVAAFLAVNPHEVVTLLIEGGVDAGALAAALAAAGLDQAALPRTGVTEPWPTLAAMITVGTRLVVFADVTGSPPAWMLPLRAYVAGTGTSFTQTSAMTCDVALGAAGAPLYLLNEFLVGDDGGACGSPALAQIANAEPFFGDRITACTLAHGSKPVFLAVDFFDVGDVLAAARAIDPPQPEP
jgi:hypothetical protein